MCGLLLGTGFKYLIVSKVWAGSDCVDAYGMCAKRLKIAFELPAPSLCHPGTLGQFLPQTIQASILTL